MKELTLVLRAAMIGLLIVSFVASGQTASLAFGLCFLIGAILAASNGIHEIGTGAATVMPDEFSFRQNSQVESKSRLGFGCLCP